MTHQRGKELEVPNSKHIKNKNKKRVNINEHRELHNGSQQHILCTVIKSTQFFNVSAFQQFLYSILHGAPGLNINVHTAVIQATKTELTWHAPLHHLHVYILYTFRCTEMLLPSDKYQ